MKVPTYNRQTARSTVTGARQLSVQANPGAFAQAAQATARLGEAAQTASLNALQIAERRETEAFKAEEQKKLAFFEAEMKNKYESELADSTLKYNQGLNDAAIKASTMDPKQSDTYFLATSQKLKKDLSKTFSSKAAQRDFFVKADLAFTNKNVSVKSNSSNRRINEQAAVLINNIEYYKKQAVVGNKAEKLEAANELFGNNGIYSKLVSLGYMTNTEATIKRQASQKDILKNTILQDFQNLSTIEQKENYINNLEKKAPGNLDNIETRVIIRSLKTDVKNLKAINKTQAASLKIDLKDVNKILTKGGTVDIEVINGLENKAKSMGADGVELIALANNLKLKKQIFDVARKTNISSLSAEITKYSTDGIPGVGEAGIDTVIETEIVNDLKTLETNMRSELKRDPLTFAERSGNVKVTPINFVQLTDPQSMDPVGDSAANAFNVRASKRISEAISVSGRYGSAVKFLKDEEAASLKAFFEDSQTSTVQKLAVLNKINQGFGRHSQDVFVELSQKGAPELAHIGGLMKLGLIDNAKFALQGLDLKNAGKLAPEATNINTQSEYSNTVGNALIFAPAEVQGAAKRVTDLIYNKLANDQGLQFFRNNVYADAAKMALGNVDDVSGHPTVIPKELDADKLEDMIEKITVQDFVNQGFNIDAKLLEDINDGEYNLYVVGDGQYKLARGTPGEPDFLIAGDKSGNEIILNALQYYGFSQ